MEAVDQEVLKKVIESAKKYFKDREGFDNSVNGVLEGDR